jgi:hypothetical protein
MMDPSNKDVDDRDDDSSPEGAPSSLESPTKREDRLKKNRQKARERRSRKKNLVETIQRNVIVLTRVNNDLRKKNQALIQELAEMGAPPPPMALAVGVGQRSFLPGAPGTAGMPQVGMGQTQIVIPNGTAAPAPIGMINPVTVGGMMSVIPQLNVNMVSLIC